MGMCMAVSFDFYLGWVGGCARAHSSYIFYSITYLLKIFHVYHTRLFIQFYIEPLTQESLHIINIEI